jgi:acyl-CoA synthetase (AMP-forming)/AMP-acid ligase II
LNEALAMQDKRSESVDAADSVPSFLRAIAAKYGDSIAVRLDEDGKAVASLSFAQLERESAALAKGLIARGVGKGTRIGFIIGNNVEFVVTLAAIARVGAVAIPFSTLIKADEMVRTLRQSDVAGLFVQRSLLGHDLVDRLCDALPALRETSDPELRLARVPYLRWIISSGPALPPTIRDAGFFADVAGTVSEELLAEVESEVHATDQAVEIYTSGSMALPKGVRHDHGPLLFRSRYLRDMQDVKPGQERALNQPMFWVGGLMMALMPSLAGGAVHVCTERTPTNSLMAMGSVLTDEDLARYGQARTHWGLGMSETLGPYSYGDILRAPGYPLCAPLDHIAERYEVRVADEDDRPVGDGEIGEIQVRGYAMTPRLHKVERSRFFTADGFYHTGDMGLVEGSRINFVGRNGDMIKTAGSNVSPAEVEGEMQQLDEVHSAYVVGLPDAQRGQLVAAAVVPREGVEIDFAALEEKLRRRLSSYKVPRVYVAITRDEVPMLFSNKVARRQIEAMLIARLGR